MTRLLSTAALSLLLAAAPLSRAASPDSAVVARVDDTEVTAQEIRSAMQSLDAKTQAAAMHDPASLSQVVRLILTQRLVLQEALAAKWDQNPAVTSALARLRDNAIAQTYLESVSAPPQSYPSDSELQAAYDANKDKFLVPKQYKLAQVFIKCPKGSDSDTATKAQVRIDAVKKVLARSNADFAAIARADSDDTANASKGGEVGWLADNRIPAGLRSQLGNLKQGTVTAPIQLDDGWHIFKVLDAKEPYTPPLDEIRTQLTQEMRSERARALSQQYIAKLVQDHPIQVDELNLSKVLK